MTSDGEMVMQTLWQDLRYGARMLWKKPGFTAVAIVTLSLGIGANTAIFSVVNGVLLRPLPYPQSDRLVMLSVSDNGGVLGNTGYATFADWRERSRSFERMAAVRSWGGTLTGQGEPEVVGGLRVSADYFQLLGVSPALGRGFRAEEDRPDTRFVIVLGHALWRRRFNSDPHVVGKPVTLSDQTFTVVGVMPEGFEDFLAANFYQPAQVWAPVGYDVAQPHACRDCQHLKAVARLKPGVTLAEAGAEMRSIMEVMAREHPKIYASPAVAVARLQDQFVGKIRPALYLLVGAVALVLLIACANVANLLLARATRRAREMAIRAALGAGRFRLVRQLLAEGLLLALAGAGGGLLLATWGTAALTALSPATMLRLQPVGADWRVLAFTLSLSLLTGLLFGLAPAWHAARQDVQLALKESGGSSPGGRQGRLRGALVVAELALALMLLAGAGLLVRSFLRALEVAPGFESRNLLTMTVPAAGAKYKEEAQVRAYYDEVSGRVAALPGVEAVGVVSNLPFGGNMDKSGFHVETKPLANPAQAPSAERYGVSPDYLRAMGIPVLRGRAFTARDGPDAPLVALVNETAAKRVWPHEDPLGQRVRLGGPNDPPRTVVGVVGDVSHYELETPPDLQAYVPHAQWTDSYMQLVVRTATDPGGLINPVREAVRAIDPNQPVYQIATMRELIATSLAPRRFTLALVAALAAVALLMAGVGIYGVMSYATAQRTPEVGIRIALGAQAADVLRLVVGQGMRLAAAGVALGLVGAFALTRLMSGLLFGVTAADPLTFAAVAALLVGVAALACYVPARRATKVDPLTALRSE
jgi:putative ABC transport system permease protein